MKRLFLLSAIAIVAICSSSCGSSSKQESQSDSSQSGAPAKPEPPVRQGWLEDIPLYGDVESVLVTTYQLEGKFGEVVRGDIEDCKKYYFNQAGDVFEKAVYSSNGSLWYKLIYKYDASGNVIEEATNYSIGSLRNRYIYKYDASGNMIEKNKYYGEALSPISQTVYENTYRK